jgi:serine/threonine-protein kinase HipA
MADLRVELYGQLVGHLVGTDWRTFDFRPTRQAVERFSLGSTILSEAIPLELVPTRARAERRRTFFAELLPEGRVLTRLANAIDAREHDVVRLLAAYGRDVAGALQIYDPGRPGEPRTPHTTPLDDDGVARLLRDVQARPLGNAPVTGKSSLAGVQDKVVLARVDGRWHQVHDGFPSTHLVKPVPDAHPTLIFDEEYGTRLTRRAGVTTSFAWLQDFDGTPGLVIERYDRTAAGERIHQEDFNQVLGARGDQKYQAISGKVSLRRVAAVFGARGDQSSLGRLLDQVTVAVGLGNLDLHTKNLSLLHPLDGPPALAPAYDVVPLRQHANDGQVALAVDGEYQHAAFTADHLVAEAESWGVRDPRPQVLALLARLRAAVEEEEPDARAHPAIRDLIDGFTRNLLSGSPVG